MTFEVWAAIAAVLTMAIPGIPLGFALFHGMKFSRIDKTLLGVILALILVPMLLFFEYLAFGWFLNVGLFLANALLVLFVSLAAYYLQAGNLKPNLAMPEIKPDVASLKRYGPAAFVLLMMAVAFYVRFAPAFTTSFYEFDPYYYMKLTLRLVQNGFIPMFSSDSYFPLQQFQHWPPLNHYMVGAWVFLHQALSGGGFDLDALIQVSEIYPPLVAAFMAYAAYLFIREEYNGYYGAAGAAMFALTPQLIQKFAGGETLQQPWGVYLAMLFATLLFLALKRSSYRLGAAASLTAVAVMLGSQQYIWPLMVFFAFLAIQSVYYFVTDTFDRRKFVTLVATAVGFLVGNTVMAIYQNQQYVKLLGTPVITLSAGLLICAILYAGNQVLRIHLDSTAKRLKALGMFLVIGLILMAVTPVGGILVSTILGQANTAAYSGTVGKTIAEEGITSPDLYPSTFGVLDPRIILLLSAMIPLLSASVLLFNRKHAKWGTTLLAVGLSLIFFKGIFNSIISSVLGGADAASIKTLILFTNNDISGYLAVGLVSSAVLFVLVSKEHKSEALLLLMLMIFPVAFIGSNRLKFLLHMSFALALAFPMVLGEIQMLLERLNNWFKVMENPASLRAGILGTLLFVAALATLAQAQSVPNSMSQLQNTRLPQDWVDTFKWMRTSSPADTRIMSWWDYGHWTTFLGERNTVVNPSNLYEAFDHEVARAFVGGKPSDLYDAMDNHHATHVMVDGDLIGKWGALVYLSGTCSKNDTAICPQTPEIPRSNSPGQSQYELAHYFENLQIAGTCPATAVGVPLPLLQSGLGAKYCMTQTDMIYLNGQGQMTNVTRRYKLVGRDNIDHLDPNTAYLFPTGQNQFINVNPYYEPFGLHNSVFESAFTQMFFFGAYPGFKLVYSSPNSWVKVYEYTGRPGSSSGTTAVTKAAPTPAASASQSAGPASSVTNASAAPSQLGPNGTATGAKAGNGTNAS